MKPTYIIRLDDACPTNNIEKWNYIESILDHFQIKPIVCITPENKNPKLICAKNDINFWERAKRWEKKDWLIALHGYSHEFISKKGGLVPLNNYSEFAGVPIDIQRDKIIKGYTKFLDNDVKPTIWVAPAHTFDKKTLKVLMEETDIRIISDGLSTLPYNQYGFFWIPQQLWAYQKKTMGVWTICIHPETITRKEIDILFQSISNEQSFFRYDLQNLIRTYKKRKKSIMDYFFQFRFFSKRKYDALYTNSILFHNSAEFVKKIIRPK